MYLSYSEEHLLIQKAAKDFAQNELKPGVISRDSNSLYPKIGVKRMAELGFLGNDCFTKIWWRWYGHPFLLNCC